MHYSRAYTETISLVLESGQISIGGGFNSRIGTKRNLIDDDRKYFDFLPDGYELDTFTTHRNGEVISLNN